MSNTHSQSFFAGRGQLLAAVILGGSVLAASAINVAARPATVAPAPVTVALVDLARLMGGLDELKYRNATGKSRGEAYQKQVDSITDEIKQIEAELDGVITQSETKKRVEALVKRAELVNLRESRKTGLQYKIDLENGETIHDLYSKALETISQIAKQDGFDLVLLDDTKITLPAAATMKEYRSIMEARRILYARDGQDITDRVMTVMNNNYAAASGGNR